MEARARAAALMALVLAALPSAALSAGPTQPSSHHARIALPIAFAPNRGQAPKQVRYLAQGAGFTLFLTRRGIFLSLAGERAGQATSALRPRLVPPPGIGARTLISLVPSGESRHVTLRPGSKLPGTVNYLIGRGPRQWRTGIPTYGDVTFRHVYPGIDLRLHGGEAGLEYDWVLRAGARVQDIAMRASGRWRLEDGLLVARTALGVVMQRQPQIYQVINGQWRPVMGGYVLRHHRIGFRLGRYDRHLPLVIDPVLSYGTVLGGGNSDYAASIAVDADGNAYVTGTTDSPDFPVFHGAQMVFLGGSTGEDGFVSKLNATGTALLYSTFIGGHANDSPVGIAVNASGDATITGFTRSDDFPVIHPLPDADGGDCSQNQNGSAMIATLSAGGKKLLFSSCLGADGTTWADRVAYDASGALHITGSTTASQFPLVDPVQSQLDGQSDAFLATIAHSRLLFSTYLGGSGGEDGTSLSLDPAGDVYVGGATTSSDFPVQDAAQAQPGGGQDAFVAKFDAANHLLWATYLGGSQDDDAWALTAVGNSGVAVTGVTASSDFPTLKAVQPQENGHTDAFVTRLDASGAMLYSTYLGGKNDDAGNGIAAAGDGSVYVAGETASADFPQVDALQTRFGGGFEDAFLTRISADGSSIISSTYLGGSQDDAATCVAMGPGDTIYVAGGTSSANFPVTSGVVGSWPMQGNAFIVKVTNQVPAKPHIAISNVWLYNLSDQSTTNTLNIKTRQQALFVVAYRDTNVHPGGASATIRFILRGKTVATVRMKPGGASDGEPSFYMHYRFPKRDIGSLEAHVRITLQGAAATRIFKFRVKR